MPALRISRFSLAKLGARLTSGSNKRLKKLPAEIVLSIIDSVALPQLIRMAHVCHEWRVLAYSHPTFWRIIEVGSVSPAALQRMLARLAASDAPIERILFQLTVDEPAIDAVVLPALAAHLHRIEHLCATFHPSKAGALFRSLHAGGPRLKELEITFYSKGMTMPYHTLLPSNLLGGQAPHLVQFMGGNVFLPDDPVAVFAGVVHAGLQATPNRNRQNPNKLLVSPLLISLHFPVLRDLLLDGSECVMDHNLVDGAFSMQLTSLYISLDDSAHKPLAFILPAARPRNIVLGRPSGRILSTVLADIAASPLRCRLGRPHVPNCDPTLYFECELSHLHDDTTRRSIELYNHFRGRRTHPPPLFSVAADWCARVAELVLEDRIWRTAGIMKWMAPFTALRRLTLHVYETDMVGSPAKRILCPALETIVVTGDPSLLLHQQERITKFLCHGLISPIDLISFRVDATSDSLRLVHQSDE